MRSRHLLRFCVLITYGAAVGTLLRDTVERAFPHGAGQWPWATFVINCVGSLVLGAVLESLALSGPDAGWRRAVRLGGGTGVLGGFTTYSTYVVEVDRLGQTGHVVTAAAYALVSVVAGVALAGVGAGAAAAAARRRAAAVEADG